MNIGSLVSTSVYTSLSNASETGADISTSTMIIVLLIFWLFLAGFFWWLKSIN